MAIIWRLYGDYMAIIWRLYGDYMAVTAVISLMYGTGAGV